MKFIIDKEINLKETDSLNSKSYSETLTETIKTTPTDKSFTIGLFGEWGSGKSSIVETSRLELESLKEEKIKFIVYDAWKYANDSFRRMFLLKVQESLKFDKTSLMNSFYLNENEDVEIKKKLNNTNLIVIIIIMVFGIILVNTLPIDNDEWKLSLSIFISFLGLFSTILFKAFDEFKINIQKPHLFAPEQFEDCFNEMISKSLKGYSNIRKALLYIQGETYEKEIDKLVIVIDNIDRCNKELAYELLTDTKSFLGQAKNVIFLIPVDDQALKKHILSSNANNTEAEEFLRKFFSVTIRIKPLRAVELFDFANKINTKNNLGFNPDTIDIVSKEYASNPRRIIQFFNNLAVEIHNFEINFDTDFIANNESLICKLLIIREEWPQYYKLLSSFPHILNGGNKTKSELIKESPDLELFLKNTKAISKNIDVTVFDKLLSNGKVFDKLTTDVKKSIDNQDFEQVQKLIADKT
ncbi:MAG: P-loop NTPase fold protein, partial [Salinivirgaceae bacterium]|nr:P-loop NTPase fold protein [Salinivirgaceae bacterium]